MAGRPWLSLDRLCPMDPFLVKCFVDRCQSALDTHKRGAFISRSTVCKLIPLA